jgi:hypothetical protein
LELFSRHAVGHPESVAATLFSKDSLIITIDVNSPGQNEDKKLRKCRVRRACPGLSFSNFPTRIWHFDNADIGRDGAVGVMI